MTSKKALQGGSELVGRFHQEGRESQTGSIFGTVFTQEVGVRIFSSLRKYLERLSPQTARCHGAQLRKCLSRLLGLMRGRNWCWEVNPGCVGVCTGHPEVTPAPCPVYAHASAPASLPQSPPAAKPGPHLEVISCLTSSRLMASMG